MAFRGLRIAYPLCAQLRRLWRWLGVSDQTGNDLAPARSDQGMQKAQDFLGLYGADHERSFARPFQVVRDHPNRSSPHSPYLKIIAIAALLQVMDVERTARDARLNSRPARSSRQLFWSACIQTGFR